MTDKQGDPLLALVHSAEQMAEATKQLAHIFATYYFALSVMQVPDDLAIPLVLDYQQHMLKGNAGQNDA